MTSSGGCTVTNVSLPKSNNSAWVNIGTDGVNESTMGSDYDGSGTWVNKTGSDLSFGSSNGSPPIPMALDTINDKLIIIIDKTIEKKILKIFNYKLQEVKKPLPMGVYILLYDDYTRRKQFLR